MEYKIKTIFGTVIIESFVDDIYDEGDSTIEYRAILASKKDEYAAQWTYGKSRDDAFDNLFRELSDHSMKSARYSTFINECDKKMYAVIHNMHNHYYSPGIKKQIQAIGWGNTPRMAAYQAHYSKCHYPGDVHDKFDELELMTDKAVIGEYEILPLSNIAVEWFSLVCNNGMSISLIIEDGIAHKESLEKEGEKMSASELGNLKALFSD